MWPEIILILIGVVVIFAKLDSFGGRLSRLEAMVPEPGNSEDKLSIKLEVVEGEVDNLRDKLFDLELDVHGPRDERSSLDSDADNLEGEHSDLERAGLDDIESRLSTIGAIKEAYKTIGRLLDAINRIDPAALRTIEELVVESAGREYEPHAKRMPHPSGYVPSVERLEGEILKIKREVQELKSLRS